MRSSNVKIACFIVKILFFISYFLLWKSFSVKGCWYIRNPGIWIELIPHNPWHFFKGICFQRYLSTPLMSLIGLQLPCHTSRQKFHVNQSCLVFPCNVRLPCWLSNVTLVFNSWNSHKMMDNISIFACKLVSCHAKGQCHQQN